MEEETDFGQILTAILEAGKIPLPVFNPIAIKVQRLIQTNPDLGRIIEMVSMDSKLSAAVLQAVNSPFYGLSVKKKTVSDAIHYLGLEESGNVVISAALSGNFASRDEQMQPYMASLWKHNLGCAIACQWLAKDLDTEISSTAFLAGMLHDFGKLTLLSAVERAKRDKRMAQIPVTDHLIADVFSRFHTQQGYQTLTKMHLPEEYCMVARDHHNIDLATENRLLLLVRSADMLAKEVGLSATSDPMEYMDANKVSRSGLEEETLSECRNYLKAKMKIS